MALGIDFLSKTRAGGMKDVMGASSANKSNAANNASVFAQKPQKAEKADADVGNMSTSDLLQYVYENKKGQKQGDVVLPAHVKYEDLDIAANGRPFDKVVDEICQKTGDSKSKVQSELKKKYATVGGAGGKGASLNMSA